VLDLSSAENALGALSKSSLWISARVLAEAEAVLKRLFPEK
jgi:hypothetical protein